MNERTAAYQKGTAKLYKFEDMKKTAIDSYKVKKSAPKKISQLKINHPTI